MPDLGSAGCFNERGISPFTPFLGINLVGADCCDQSRDSLDLPRGSHIERFHSTREESSVHLEHADDSFRLVGIPHRQRTLAADGGGAF